MKEIVVLGSTGSIGTQMLEVAGCSRDMHIKALAAGGNVDLLETQAASLMPELVCMYDKEKALELERRLKKRGLGGRIFVTSGMEGLIECATIEGADIVVAAIVGMIGIRPVVAAIEAGKDIAFANKETLVTAGHIIMPLVRERGVSLMPVDSEHAAIFQCINGEKGNKISKIFLTASGGPFRGRKKEDLANVGPEDALKHPNWHMGKIITIDSSTMANKGLEVIEARWLFDVPFDDIEVVIQPQSVIHSMVEFEDGAVMAQLGTPDMRLPIQYALSYPKRRPLSGERLDFAKIGQISFEKPDTGVFEALALAYEAGRAGGSMTTVYNSANEKAVSLFLSGGIKFLQIADIIKECMKRHSNIANPSLDDIFEVERETHSFIDYKYGGVNR